MVNAEPDKWLTRRASSVVDLLVFCVRARNSFLTRTSEFERLRDCWFRLGTSTASRSIKLPDMIVYTHRCVTSSAYPYTRVTETRVLTPNFQSNPPLFSIDRLLRFVRTCLPLFYPFCCSLSTLTMSVYL